MAIKKINFLIRGAVMLSLLAMFFSGLIGCKKSGQAAASGRSQKIIMKYADVVSTSDPQYQAAQLLAQKMAEKTAGLVEIQVYPNSQLGSTKEVTEGLKLGTVEIVKTANAFFTGFMPETKLLDLPYLFSDREQARRALDGEIGDYLKEAAKKRGYKILWYFTPRGRSLYTSVGPIFKPEDMKGIKIRVMDSPIMIDAINSMGGNAVPLPFGEVYSALEQQVVDGAENSVISYSAMKHSEVARYFSETNHFYSPELVVMDLNYFNQLPPNVQTAFEVIAHEVIAYEAKIYNQQVSSLKSTLSNEGNQFNETDLAAFRKKMLPLFEKHADKVGGMEIIKKAMDY